MLCWAESQRRSGRVGQKHRADLSVRVGDLSLSRRLANQLFFCSTNYKRTVVLRCDCCFPPRRPWHKVLVRDLKPGTRSRTEPATESSHYLCSSGSRQTFCGDCSVNSLVFWPDVIMRQRRRQQHTWEKVSVSSPLRSELQDAPTAASRICYLLNPAVKVKVRGKEKGWPGAHSSQGETCEDVTQT